MKILIVDDSKVGRMLVIRALSAAGFVDHELEHASNGVEGLAAVKRIHPDLVLSDLNMPQMDGMEFLRTLRRRGDAPPFVFVTSEGTEQTYEEAMAAGAEGLIVKPYTPVRFQAMLGRFLGTDVAI
ncbi:MAG: response regulator [Nannocystaceae bacterium]